MSLALPTGFKASRWRLNSNAQRFRSPITRVGQTVARVGDFWSCQFETRSFSALFEEDHDLVGEWAAILARMTGGAEFAYIPPPYRVAHGTLGTPRIKGAAQTGEVIVIDGLPAGKTIKAGSPLSYDTSTFRALHICAETTQADGSGEIELPIRPMIRKSPADNALVNFATPTCEMILEAADADIFTLTEAIWYGHAINLIENVRE